MRKELTLQIEVQILCVWMQTSKTGSIPANTGFFLHNTLGYDSKLARERGGNVLFCFNEWVNQMSKCRPIFPTKAHRITCHNHQKKLVLPLSWYQWACGEVEHSYYFCWLSDLLVPSPWWTFLPSHLRWDVFCDINKPNLQRLATQSWKPSQNVHLQLISVERFWLDHSMFVWLHKTFLTLITFDFK